MNTEHVYRGIRIESYVGTQMGHTTQRGTASKAGIGTKRQARSFVVHYPDDGGSTVADTLKEAKRRVDLYLD